MEATQRRGIEIAYVNEREEESSEEEADPEEDNVEERFVRAIMGISYRPKMEVPICLVLCISTSSMKM
jgi:hypothetical protein